MAHKPIRLFILFKYIETFYSLVALNESELENTRGPMVVRVYRSGDVSQSATVTLRTFTTSKYNLLSQ